MKDIPILEHLSPQIRQALVVIPTTSGGSLAELIAWERSGLKWQQSLAVVSATIGRGGMVPAEDKVEGDGCTPKGIYSLGIVFGSQPAVKTTMSYREIKADDYWIDDPASPDYNRWVSGKLPNVSFEQMLRQDGLYRYGVVIEYNTQPVVAGKGSAIFMHIWKAPGEPTSGCVALAETDLLQVITWLTPEKHPVIIMEDGLAG